VPACNVTARSAANRSRSRYVDVATSRWNVPHHARRARPNAQLVLSAGQEEAGDGVGASTARPTEPQPLHRQHVRVSPLAPMPFRQTPSQSAFSSGDRPFIGIDRRTYSALCLTTAKRLTGVEPSSVSADRCRWTPARLGRGKNRVVTTR